MQQRNSTAIRLLGSHIHIGHGHFASLRIETKSGHGVRVGKALQFGAIIVSLLSAGVDRNSRYSDRYKQRKNSSAREMQHPVLCWIALFFDNLAALVAHKESHRNYTIT